MVYTKLVVRFNLVNVNIKRALALFLLRNFFISTHYLLCRKNVIICLPVTYNCDIIEKTLVEK